MHSQSGKRRDWESIMENGDNYEPFNIRLKYYGHFTKNHMDSLCANRVRTVRKYASLKLHR